MGRVAVVGLGAAGAVVPAMPVGLVMEFAQGGGGIYSWPVALLALAVIVILVGGVRLGLLPTRPPAVILGGLFLGVVAFGVAETTYVVSHLARGGELNFEMLDSQREMAAGLILGAFLALGLPVGLAAGLLALAAEKLIAVLGHPSSGAQ